MTIYEIQKLLVCLDSSKIFNYLRTSSSGIGDARDVGSNLNPIVPPKRMFLGKRFCSVDI